MSRISPAVSPSRTRGATGPYLVAACGAGVLLPMQGRVNAGLNLRIGDGVQAGVLSSVSGLLFIAALAAVLPSVRRSIAAIPAALRVRAFPRWAMLAGAVGGYFIFAQGVVAAAVGIALFTIANVAGQTLGSLATDAWGIGPAGRRRITPERVAGTAMILGAVLLTVAPDVMSPAAGGPRVGLLVLPFTAGLLYGLQTVMTGLRTAHYGSFIPATLFNFVLGTLLLAVLVAIRTVGDGTLATPPTEAWYYLGGPLGVMCVGLASYLAKHLGVLMTSLGMITGQLVGALALEIVWPAGSRAGFPLLELLATVVAVGGVAVASARRTNKLSGQLSAPPPTRSSPLIASARR